jgi:hypothetical protein
MTKDREEQLRIAQLRDKWATASASASALGSGPTPSWASDTPSPSVSNQDDHGSRYDNWEQEAMSDTDFFHWLDASREHAADDGEGSDEFMDGDDSESGDRAEEDVHGFQPYLGETSGMGNTVPDDEAEASSRLDLDPDVDMEWTQARRPGADGLNNSYVRVLHTNGIHHLAMVTCNCQGEHHVALDLVACRLLPASFARI